jgi:uncharacterized small protein (DUF1192 family)
MGRKTKTMFDPFGDEKPAKKPLTHEIGQDLATLSVDELAERIALLKTEILRLEAAKLAKEASKQSAESVFKARP